MFDSLAKSKHHETSKIKLNLLRDVFKTFSCSSKRLMQAKNVWQVMQQFCNMAKRSNSLLDKQIWNVWQTMFDPLARTFRQWLRAQTTRSNIVCQTFGTMFDGLIASKTLLDKQNLLSMQLQYILIFWNHCSREIDILHYNFTWNRQLAKAMHEHAFQLKIFWSLEAKQVKPFHEFHVYQVCSLFFWVFKSSGIWNSLDLKTWNHNE